MRDRWGAEQDSAMPDVRKTPRWIAGTVMLTACVGFVGLAWYAYNAGTRVMRDDEVALVEPDTAPVKEKPANPGGMQFPNQDKTIFQAASSQPPKADTVERVLPGPEEPVNRQKFASDQSKDWINEKLNTAADKGSAQQPTLVEKAAPPASTKAEAAAAMAPAAGAEGAVAPAAPPPTVSAAPAAAPAAGSPTVELKKEEATPAAEAPATQEAPAAPEKPEAKAAPAKKAAAMHRGGKGMVQLGSYRSSAEADRAWKKLHGKYKSLLSSSPEVERADLGEKGTYFRLRTHVGDPKAVCQTLVAKGQPCIVAK